jgi:hypothetical protein
VIRRLARYLDGNEELCSRLWNGRRSRPRRHARLCDFEDEHDDEHDIPGYQESKALVSLKWKVSMAGLFLLAAVALSEKPSTVKGEVSPEIRPGTRVLLDAHNCYPYHGKWSDRIERALGTGLPLAIEQDLFWYTDKQTGKSWSILSHGKPVSGNEPTLRVYFFERIRPVIEKALRDGNQGDWPLVTLNLDFKSNEPEHHAAVWALLGEYESWLCTAERVEDGHKMMPLLVRPLWVLTGDSDIQEKTFYSLVPVGKQLRLFGAIHVRGDSPVVPAEAMVREQASNYRRWWNSPWRVVEEGGQRKAKAWTKQDMQRLRSLVDQAHALGLWIRFYTLNGHEPVESQGWDQDYNFGSKERVLLRWRAALEAGVDFVATDQYETFASMKVASSAP